MKRKILSLVLVLVMLLSLAPAIETPAMAASSNGSDALSALGIDTSKAPGGYDPLSTSNPYGKNTVEVSPVAELYTVGLQKEVSYDSSFSSKSKLEDGETTNALHSAASQDNTLKSVLYGNEKWDATTAKAIMESGDASTIAGGKSAADGLYTLVSSGNISSTAATDITANGYLTDAKNASTDLGGGFKFALSSVAAGNFDGNTSGLAAQTAMVYTSDYSKNGGLYLRFGNAKSGSYGSSAIKLLDTSEIIGNPDLKDDDGKNVEDFANNPYQLQNYLQVATGDWNGDGFDEVAVYIPEKGNSRIAVYALKHIDTDDKTSTYLDASKWELVWTYYLHEGDVVSNMVSFVSGDVNKDGTDDLAATWGYYYGPDQNIGSTAVVMFGAKNTSLFTKSQQFNLTYGTSNIVRASFTFGDMAGSNSNVLILCGQSDADLKKKDTDSRYVALYSWDGSAFTSNISQNFDLFAKDSKGNFVWSAMQQHGSAFYSMPLCAANAAVIKQGVGGGGDLLYFDSLIIEYTKNGLNIKEAWDESPAMQVSVKSQYVEYGAVSGDLTGKTGSGTLATMTQTLSSTEKNSADYTLIGEHQVPIYKTVSYYKNWVRKLLGMKSHRTVFDHYENVKDEKPVSVDYTKLTMGKAYMVFVDPFTTTNGNYYNTRTETDYSEAICLANTDNDSSYMNYSGQHSFSYTDPKILAVLASPPYFSDLLGRSDLSGSYAQSATSYSSTSGSGSGKTLTATIKAGAYVAYEHDFEVFGAKVGSVEAEESVTVGFTYDTEKTSTLEQTVTYTASSGEDMVALYSIPMEKYQYTSYVPDGRGSYTTVLTCVNIPHEAAVKLLPLKDYENIAKDYKALPSVAKNVLSHTVGDPASYPSSSNGYNVVAEYSGTPSAVGFTSSPNGASISQEIAMSTENNSAYTISTAIEGKAGGGPGDIKVGVIAGAEAGAGEVTISTNGSAFSGSMQNMPAEAEAYGYAMNWKIFCYSYRNGNIAFPVVSYIVSDVTMPPSLPDDFTQDIADTTSNSIALTWSYNKLVAGFRLYRYYEFPDGHGSYELKFVPFTDALRYDKDTGTYYFKYIDQNLNPYTEYKYQIKTVCATNPKESIYSEPMTCRTKTDVGYPVITLTGLDDEGNLDIYPDADSTVTADVQDSTNYSGLSYQWQKLSGGSWTDIAGSTGASLIISKAGSADAGLYRCRVNVIYYDKTAAQTYYISAYSPQAPAVYSKRSSKGTLTAKETTALASDGSALDGLSANFVLDSASTVSVPTGNATFTVTGTDYQYSETTALSQASSAGKYFATASLSLPNLPVGVYTVTAYYGGSSVFKDCTSESVLVIVGEGSTYTLNLASVDSGSPVTQFDYGSTIYPSLVHIFKDEKGDIQKTTMTNVTYKLDDGKNVSDFTAGSKSPYVGSYTMQASLGGNTYAQKFAVNAKAATITATDKPNVSAGTVDLNQPEFVGTGIPDEDLAALKLGYSVTNSAGNPTKLDNKTDPGNYTVTACSGENTPRDLYSCYNITYVSGTYTIVGATYQLTVEAADYTDKNGTRCVGKAGISNDTKFPAYYASGTAVLLYAVPSDGYVPDTWTAVFKNGTTKTQEGGSTFPLTTQSQEVAVSVSFKPAEITLYTLAQPAEGGKITCSDKTFSSGAHVSCGAEFTFTAVPAEGYTFGSWQTVSGSNSATPAGTANADGSNSLAVSVGSVSTTVYAKFVRNPYKLTLTGDIKAYYMYDKEGAPTQKEIPSGGSVPGDTEITVLPKTGYQAAKDACFTVNDTATTDSLSHVFKITEDTSVSLKTVRNSYAVSASGENGTVAVTVDGKSASGDALKAVPGGSALSFSAKAVRGYVFDHWTINGKDSGSTNPLNISELGENTAVTAVFAANEAYKVTADVSAPTRGVMKYTLTDIYGAGVGTPNTEMPKEGLTVYKGEAVTLTVSVNTGSMVEQWKVNDTPNYTNKKSYTVDSITGDIAATAYLKEASSYNVYYTAMGTGGGTLTAKADGTDFVSGTLQSGGSELLFTANPASGFMTDHWTLTDGDITAKENTSNASDSAGNLIVDPTLTIDGLNRNLTLRVYFTEIKTCGATLPGVTAGGTSYISYVTPTLPSDNGSRTKSVAENVRLGGTVKMTLTPASGYCIRADALKAALAAKVNSDAVITLEAKEGTYNLAVYNLKQTFELKDSDIYKVLHSITVPSGVTASTLSAAAGDTVTLTVSPGGNTLSELTLDKGTLNETVSASRLTYTFAMPDSDVSVSVKFTSSGGYIGGGTAVSTLIVPVSGNAQSITVPVTVTNNSVSLSTDGSTLKGLVSANGTILFDLSALKGATGIVIPAQAFGVLRDAAKTSNISAAILLPGAKVTFDSAAIATLSSAGSGDLSLTAAVTAAGVLTAEKKAVVGDRPVIDLSLTVGGKALTDLGAGSVLISVPYVLQTGESADAIVVWSVNGKGIYEPVSGGYDLNAKAVTFNAVHLSRYVLGFLPFTDVSRGAWYFNNISFAYANNLFNGTGDKIFEPQTAMTRGMLVTVIWRMEGSPDAVGKAAFTDVPSTEWYAKAVNWASSNGIISGYGDGKFGPNDMVTREQTAVILMNYAKLKKYDLSAPSDLSGFKDSESVSAWARGAVQWAASKNLMNGAGGYINPRDNTARCQVAAILQRFIENIVK